MGREKITTSQMYSILFVGRILSVLTFITNIYVGYLHPNLFVAYPLAYVLMTILFLPMYFLWKNNQNLNIADCSREVSEKFSKIIYFIYALYFIYTASMGVGRFVLFATSCLEPNQSSLLQILLIVVTGCYIAYLGIESLGRTTSIVLIIICVGILLIFRGLIDKIDILNFEPIMYRGVEGIVENTFAIMSQTTEIIALGFFLPYSSGNVKKGYAVWILGLISFIFIIIFSTIGTIGPFASTQLFPAYTATVLSSVSVFQRLDSLQTAIWLCAIVLKVSYSIILSASCFGHFVTNIKKNILVPIIGLIIVVLTLFSQTSISTYAKMASSMGNVAIFILLLFVIPLFVLIALKIKRRKNSEKNF